MVTKHNYNWKISCLVQFYGDQCLISNRIHSEQHTSIYLDFCKQQLFAYTTLVYKLSSSKLLTNKHLLTFLNNTFIKSVIYFSPYCTHCTYQQNHNMSHSDKIADFMLSAKLQIHKALLHLIILPNLILSNNQLKIVFVQGYEVLPEWQKFNKVKFLTLFPHRPTVRFASLCNTCGS